MPWVAFELVAVGMEVTVSGDVAVAVKTVLGSHFALGIGELTTHFGTYFSGDWLMFTGG